MSATTTGRRVATNGVTLEVLEAGPADGPPVLLLHGFPEPASSWLGYLDALALAGFRGVAPDQRGYGRSDKPKGVASYRLDELVADVVGLIDDLGAPRASVVAHDWGGVVAWAAIARHPDRFDRAVILNAPHPDAMVRAVRQDIRQFLRSWYTLAFQIPRLPEALLRRRDYRALTRGLVGSSRPGTFPPEVLATYRRAWAEPGALTAMIGWYRSAFRERSRGRAEPLVRVPTLLLWGLRDRFLGPGVARSSYALCQDARLEWFDDATHWIQHEEQARVIALILGFLAEVRSEPAHQRG